MLSLMAASNGRCRITGPGSQFFSGTLSNSGPVENGLISYRFLLPASGNGADAVFYWTLKDVFFKEKFLRFSNIFQDFLVKYFEILKFNFN